MRHGRVRGLCVILLLSLVTVGCLGDPPPDPRVAPLEIVAGGRQRPDQSCVLNRDEVSAGTHEVSVVADNGPAVVRLRDSAGVVVFEAEGPGGSGPAPHVVRLSEGTYTVECRLSARSLPGVTLRVVPGR